MGLFTIILISFVFLGFFLMTKGILSQEVAMPLVALIALSLVYISGSEDGINLLGEGFREFSRIAVLFTAVAVPAHILQRSNLLDVIGMRIGELIGEIHIKTKISILFLVPALGLAMVMIMAALFHNTTSILVSSTILFVICDSYKIKGLPVLAGALIASNLGGFSTRWGDTPNIVEAAQWGLTHLDFFREILPINFVALLILIFIVAGWLWVGMKRNEIRTGSKFEITYVKNKFRGARKSMSLDHRLIFFGFAGLILAIVGPLFFLKYELVFSALAIIISVLGDYSTSRSKALLALGIETYATLASIFVLAQVLSNSTIGIGTFIKQWLTNSNMSVWAISTASYAGTLLTEAASWASAATPIVHAQAPSHVAAWALGSGIFAGSSSLVTAASAGIILSQETKSFPEGNRITFGSYVIFGLAVSLLMLGFYVLVLTIVY